MCGKREHANELFTTLTQANTVTRSSEKAKEKLIKELKKLMYQYSDEEWCIELQGDCCTLALCCNENECTTTTIECNYT